MSDQLSTCTVINYHLTYMYIAISASRGNLWVKHVFVWVGKCYYILIANTYIWKYQNNFNLYNFESEYPWSLANTMLYRPELTKTKLVMNSILIRYLLFTMLTFDCNFYIQPFTPLPTKTHVELDINVYIIMQNCWISTVSRIIWCNYIFQFPPGSNIPTTVFPKYLNQRGIFKPGGNISTGVHIFKPRWKYLNLGGNI